MRTLPVTQSWRPARLGRRERPRLGQLPESLTGGLAERIVREVEPAFRRVVREERNRFAEALLEGLPFASLAGVAFTGTAYLVPDKMNLAKTLGYTSSAALLGWGAWTAISKLRETAAPEAAPTPPGPLAPYAEQAARAIVNEAEPRIRKIVDEERARLAEAAQVGLPLTVAGAAAFLATLFLVDDKNKALKAVGYTGSTLLAGAGTWLALEKERGA